MTNPACTPLVSAALEKLERWNSAASAGITADAENQSAIAATWQNAMTAIDPAFDCAIAFPTTAPRCVLRSASQMLRSVASFCAWRSPARSASRISGAWSRTHPERPSASTTYAAVPTATARRTRAPRAATAITA